jgi:SAM-dependent MidA family methyltransferase
MVQRLQAVGGAVPFRTFMEWALHDPDHGAYGTGRLRVGPRGDFATSPSLGPAFADLLAPQLAEWLQALGPGPLALIETGPGEGDLARQLAAALALGWPELAARLELVLVEPNAGMAARQRQRLAGAPQPVRWCDWQELAARPLRGVMLAHEVLDALAVERLIWDGALWRQQLVALEATGDLVLAPGAPVADWALAQLSALGMAQLENLELEAAGLAAGPAPGRPAGWCSELHPGLEPWLGAAAAALSEGVLLVVDYALEARRYYSLQRSSGTLMAYQGQQASPDPLRQPGHWDLTAHLCLESLERAAAAAGWRELGQCRQGQALLALGLAGALHGLQQPGSGDLAERLARREALLRLVDPAGLGEFRWIALGRGAAPCARTPRFLREPAG